jgi:hypothetical protein
LWWKFDGERVPGGMPENLELGARVSERWSPGRCVTVDLREPPAITEDPMTDDRMALTELLQKSGDGDFLRSVAEAVLQILMEADVEGLIGAGRHERTGAWRPDDSRLWDVRTGEALADSKVRRCQFR